MQLTEIFDKPAPIKWGTEGKTITGEFIVDEEKYGIYFSPAKDDGKIIWIIEFGQKIAGKKRMKTGLTGAGKEFQVFSTVISAIRDWIKKKKPQSIEFEGSGESRNKLYKRLVKTLVKTVPYKMLSDKDMATLGYGGALSPPRWPTRGPTEFGTYRLERK